MDKDKLKSWDEYSDESDQNELCDENPNVIDAKIDLFLRKYTSFPLKKEELIDIFIQENFDEKRINLILDKKLKETVKELLNKAKEGSEQQEMQKINQINSINYQCENECQKRNKSCKDKTEKIQKTKESEQQHRNKSFQPNKILTVQKENDINSKCSKETNDTENSLKDKENKNFIPTLNSKNDFFQFNDSTNCSTHNNDGENNFLLELKKINSGEFKNKNYIKKNNLRSDINYYDFTSQSFPGTIQNSSNQKNKQNIYENRHKPQQKSGLELAFDYYSSFLESKNL